MRQVLTLADLADASAKRIKLGDKAILLVRDGDTVRAFAADCPHAGGPLEAGAVVNGRIVCPWHKGAFCLQNGAVLEPPPLDALTRYPVRVENGAVLVSPEPLPGAPASAPAATGTMLVVGAGAAGTAAVVALREAGSGFRVVLAGPEPGLPYDRTVLSKFVMAGGMKLEEVPPLRDAAWFEAAQVERLTAPVTRLDVAGRRAVFGDGRGLTWDAALVATGGKPKRLGLPGEVLQGVHRLRSPADAAAILRSAQAGGPAVVLGSGFIGMEVAAGLRERGLAVTVVTPEKVPLARQFGPEIGAALQRLHQSHGVAFRLGARPGRLDGEGHVTSVVLAGGERLAASLVVVGAGVRPVTGFIDGVPLTADGGLPVDGGMRVADGLYAAGDVAAFPYRGETLRIEHWRVAQQHARVAARNMLGGTERYHGVPFFWTYHFGMNVEYLGHAGAWDDVVLDGDLAALRFVAFLVQAGQVCAVVACQREAATAALIEHMRAPLGIAEARRLVGAR